MRKAAKVRTPIHGLPIATVPTMRSLSLLRMTVLTATAFVAAAFAMVITLVVIGLVVADGAQVSLFFLVLYLGAKYWLAPILLVVYFAAFFWGVVMYGHRRKGDARA